MPGEAADAIDLTSLPAEVAALIERLQQQTLADAQELLRREREIAQARVKIDKLNFELARLKRWKFDAKTESMTSAQRLLFAEVMAEADVAVRRMSHDQKVRMADEIYAQQPNMLASILALPRMGVDMALVALHVLFVTFQAMKLSGHPWPLVTEDIQEGCLQRLTARARFNEGLPQELVTKFVEQFHTEHAERYLLAFVYGWLDENDLMGVRTEAEKYLMLGALNLVECVAFVGAVKPRQ